ncbi:DUF7322 domain-containing protein [Halobaculum magnesiiphilum]|uniref:DUF7322 domain-containing protein n=1 Tax=Halobaculum magnesiiphilum TaxID=1017351 RepID=A0A8T8WBZ0_9EURY|nr:hypothetical protein [Halobaculum magnesiiphilum]QZP37336.1 hypothetical protein K6T50_13790 [Halobaculum magnesiiphilum]
MLGEDDDDGELFDLERQASEAEGRGPRVDVPSVDDPSDSLPDPSTVDPAIQRAFVTAVVYANVALLGVSLGLMLVGFRGDWRLGGASIVIGVLAGVRVYQTVRSFKQRDTDEDTDAGADEDAPASTVATPDSEDR